MEEVIYIFIVVLVSFIALIGMFKRILPFTSIPLILMGFWLIHVFMYPKDHNLFGIEIIFGIPIFFLVLALMSLVDSFLLFKDQNNDND